MANYTTSANLPYGSRVITIDSVGYIANNISIASALNVVERMDENGEPNGAVGFSTAKTGTAQLQLATTGTAYPSEGDEFSTTSQGSAITFFLTDVGEPEDQQGFKAVDISFRQVI